MKNSVLFLTILVFVVFGCQPNKPPEDVSDAFQKKFPAAEKVIWQQEEENEWEAEFMMGEKKMSACFDNSGNWFETETEVSVNELPSSVVDSIHVKYVGFEIEEASGIEKIDFEGFEIKIVKGEEELELMIGEDGTISSIREAEDVDIEEELDE
jgi:hypothetical protein